MKKLFCTLLALSLLLFTFCFPASAASGVTVQMENSYLQAGEKVYLNITFNAGRYVQAFEFTVNYDPTVLTFKEASDGVYNNYESGKIKYIDVGSGTTDTVTFVFVAKNAGKAEVSLTGIAAADMDEYTYSDVSYSFTVDKPTRGDADGDGSIDSSDLAVLKLHLAGSYADISDFADYNRDSVVDTVDLAYLKQYLAEG